MIAVRHPWLRGWTGRGAETAPDADDPRLRGRTYAIPFEEVWQAAVRLSSGALRRWRLVSADDVDGVLRAEHTSALLRRDAAVTVRIRLDDDGQTRVDLRSAYRDGHPDLGANARRIHCFVKSLDRELTRTRVAAGRGAPARLI